MFFGLIVLAFSSFLELQEENIIIERIKSNRVILFAGFTIIAGNVSPLGEVASYVTVYFPLKIIFLAKRKREFTTKFAILPNGC